jgi:hypothetical protein
LIEKQRERCYNNSIHIYGGQMYTIDFNDDDKTWNNIVTAMDEQGIPFSRLLALRGDLFEPKMSWLRFRAELIHAGKYRLLNEIEQLERVMVTDKVERELYDSYNSGDKDGVDICLKTLNGIIAKSKLGLSKLESDRRIAETGLKAKELAGKGLDKYSTDELEKMLKLVEAKEKEGAGDK